jgi:predicted nucleic acid-binding protein
MVKVLFDTNILIDYLKADVQARSEIRRHRDSAISIVSWMEVMVGAPPEAEVATRSFLDGFARIELDDEVAAQAVRLRRLHRMKLPDAIIWASAQTRSMLLVTRNTKGYPADDPGIRVPYRR